MHPEYRAPARAVAALCGAVWAAVVPFGVAGEGPSTTITSQTMTAEGDSQRVIFQGEVVLKKDDFVMRSDRMIVTFDEGASAQRRHTGERTLGEKIQRIEASGRVEIERPDGSASSGRAVYYKGEEKIVLTESPIVWQRGTKVTGSRMTMFFKQDRSIIDGGTQVTILDGREP